MSTSDAPTQFTESDSITRSLDAVRSIVRALRLNTRAIEGKIGMSLAQLFVLQELAKRGSESLNDLAVRTATHQSSVSVVVSRLVSRGLATKMQSSFDRRRTELAITDAGRELVARAPETVSARLIASLAAMQPEERQSLADLMERWLDLARIDRATAPMFLEDEPPQ